VRRSSACPRQLRPLIFHHASSSPAPVSQTDASRAIVVHKNGEPLTDFELQVQSTLSEIAKENTSLFAGLTCVRAPLLGCGCAALFFLAPPNPRCRLPSPSTRALQPGGD